MLNKESFVKYGILMSACVAPVVGAAQTLGFETIKTVRESDPLIITGAIGTQSTFYHSSSIAVSSPLTASAYANLNISVYGISMPFSFYYSTDNTSFTYPQFAFSLTPTYRGWTLLLGERSMQFSPYVFNMPFNGVGIEYQGTGSNRLRFGTFYGTLRRAINDDPDDPSARTPQYRRTGWGVKVGYGSSSNYLDIFLFRAQDHQSSIDEVWFDRLNAKENISTGLSGRCRLGSHFDLSGNLAASLYSTDTKAQEVELQKHKFISHLITPRYTTNFRMAGDMALSTHWNHVSATLQYKQVQPDYTTLGVSFMTANYQSLGAFVNTNFNNLSLSGSFSSQNDNLDDQQLFTTRALVYNANASWVYGQHFSVTAAYNGYRQLQDDGTMVIADSVRIDRLMNSYSLCPTYSFYEGGRMHSANFTANYTSNLDLNPLSDGNSDVHTMAFGLGYNLGIQALHTNMSANISHQNSDGYDTNYQTNLYSYTISRTFLQQQNLQASATLSLTDNKIKGQARNISFGGMAHVGYTLQKVHNFGLAASYNRYTNISYVYDAASAKQNNLRVTLSYNYTFQALHIGKKAENGKRKIESDWYRSPEEASNSSATAIRKAVSRSERQQAALRAMQAYSGTSGQPRALH